MSKNDSGAPWWTTNWVYVVALVVWVVFIALPYVLVSFRGVHVDVERAGQIGDASGLANSMVNSIAFFLLVHSLKVQQKQLDHQKEASDDERELATLSALVAGLTARYEALSHQQQLKAKADPSVLDDSSGMSIRLRLAYTELSLEVFRLRAIYQEFAKDRPRVTIRLKTVMDRIKEEGMYAESRRAFKKRRIEELQARIERLDSVLARQRDRFSRKFSAQVMHNNRDLELSTRFEHASLRIRNLKLRREKLVGQATCSWP